MSEGINTNGDFSWWRWAAQQSAMTVFLGCAAYFLAFYIVIPLRDDQKAFLMSVMDTNKVHAAAQSQLTQVQMTQANTLATLVDEQRKTTAILQQIRDDQRVGAWNKARPLEP
jgi:hypothetical protein